MAAPVPVRPGQIWADKNQWNAGRTVRIVEVHPRFAVYDVVTEADKPRTVRSTVGQRHCIKYSSQGIRGYRLISAPEFPGAPGSLWRDCDGDMWVMCEDGKMRMTRRPTLPHDVDASLGPMTRYGGAA